MRGSASRPSCAAWPTTPTIVIHVESFAPRRRAEGDSLADRIGVGEVLLHEFLIDDGDARRAKTVLVGEEPALLERNTQRVEESR